MRTPLAALALLMLFTVAPSGVHAQETAVRFPVAGVGDTTFTFRVGQLGWVRPGLLGMVVDPREQDILVARFRIAGVSAGTARAVVTGQTTNVTTAHMVLIYPPSVPWYQRKTFWGEPLLARSSASY